MRAAIPMLLIAFSAPLLAQEPDAAPVPASITVGMRVGDLPSGYDDGGSRDPFTSLVAPKRTTTGAAVRRRPGLGSMALADVSVRGIVRNGKTMFAILEVPGKQSYVARLKDRLLDATVQSIDDQGVVFLADDGSGSPAAQVRKDLRSAIEAGEIQ